MDWGAITTLIAAVFGFLGIVVGIFISKFLSPKKEKGEEENIVPELLSRLEKGVEEFESLLASLSRKVESLTKEEISKAEQDIEEILSLLNSLKENISSLELSQDSLQALDKAIKAAEDLKFSVPQIDTSLLMKIKDNLLIIRNDVQALLLSRKERVEEKKPSSDELKKALSSLESALKLAKELNANLVKDELIVMANCLKSEDKNELLKAIDKEALTSKELVLLIREIKKELEGVVE